MEENKVGVSSFYLKLLAVITMLIDHIGAVLLPEYILLRCIGRIAFPIYCFLLVEGAVHTSDIRKYQMRLLFFALLSEIPYDLAHSGTLLRPDQQNVFFTLFLGLLGIRVLEKYNRGFISALTIFFITMSAGILQTDYSFGGVCFILAFYIFYRYNVAKYMSFIVLNFFFFGGIQNFAILSLIPIAMYNGKRGPKIKYAFYIFYPLHLFLLFLIRHYIGILS